MTTLEELVYYCNEPELVGALMLTGEWGCGKTYLLEHDLKDELSNTHIILRISLFGLTSITAIDECVRNTWLNAYLEDKGWDEKGKLVTKLQEKLSRLPLPENLKNIASFNVATLLTVVNELNGKKVVLIFDDLERCKLNTIDVLGCINDYCENQKFHTIIVANEDKMQHSQQKFPQKTSVTREHADNEEHQVPLLLCCPYQQDETETISYDQIKEKIIERTIKYKPDYIAIVHAVIANMSCLKRDYHEFLKQNESDILSLFAPVSYDEDSILDKSNYLSLSKDNRPHNIRSLKCALQDFYRVYQALIDNHFSDINRWLCSFMSYMLAYKAGIAKEGYYGTIFTDKEVRTIYPMFNDSRSMFKTAKNWILRGEWDIRLLEAEIKAIKEREKAVEPKDVVRTNCILHVDEEIVLLGFPFVLEMAYKGELSLDEYINFILNSYLARKYNFVLPDEVNWNKVESGIHSQISILTDQQVEDQKWRSSISCEDKSQFIPEELAAYELIENFYRGNFLMFNNNKKLYLDTIVNNPSALFNKCENKRFDVFDEEMAIATAAAFTKGNNYEKLCFKSDFISMWQHYKSWSDIRIIETVKGFRRLCILLEEEKKILQSQEKMIALGHTLTFIKSVEELIQVASM